MLISHEPFPRLFLHFFDVHFLESKGLWEASKLILWECRIATRLAIIAADQVIIPASSFVEATICKRVVGEFFDLFTLGVIKISGNASNLLEYCESQLPSYQKNSSQAVAYSHINRNTAAPPFFPRKRSATRDIRNGWLNQLDSPNFPSRLFEGTGILCPKGFERSWEKVPERLEGKAFIVDHVKLHFEKIAKHTQIRNRFHAVINSEYFESYTQDIGAGIVTELVYLNADYPIKSHGPNLPYRPLIHELRKARLLSYIQKCSPVQLLQLRDDPKWIEALSAALCKEQETIDTRRKFYLGKKQMKKKVFVVYGRDKKASRGIFDLLRAAGLIPLEWEQMVQLTGKGTPHPLDVINVGFKNAQAIVVLFTGDDLVAIKEELLEPGESPEKPVPQPRPNVLLEAGMALAIDQKRTIIVQLGSIREITDLSGLHVVRLDDSVKKRKTLLTRLESADCDVDLSGDHWMDAGDF